MTDDPSSPTLQRFPIQLADVFCVRAHIDRRDRQGDEGAESSEWNVGLAYSPLDDDARAFRTRLQLNQVIAVLDDELAEIEIVVQGQFASETPIDHDLYLQFVQYTPLVQLWPYARAYIAELARMVGVDLPPIPLIDALARVEDNADGSGG